MGPQNVFNLKTETENFELALKIGSNQELFRKKGKLREDEILSQFNFKILIRIFEKVHYFLRFCHKYLIFFRFRFAIFLTSER